MVEVSLWHVEHTAHVATIDGILIYRTVHVPLGLDYAPLDRPERRTSLNIWRDPTAPPLDLLFFRDVRLACGDDPIWIGIPLCCKLPSFWGIETETEVLE